MDSSSKIYNINGIEIMVEDFHAIKDNDIVYVTKKNQPFDWISYINCYDKVQYLGSGGYGTVVLLRHKLCKSQEVAAKYIDISMYYEKADQVEHAMKEAHMLLKLKHQSILPLYNVFCVKKTLVLFTQQMKGGELQKYLDERE